jgi:hypothetical protein
VFTANDEEHKANLVHVRGRTAGLRQRAGARVEDGVAIQGRHRGERSLVEPQPADVVLTNVHGYGGVNVRTGDNVMCITDFPH